MGLVNIGYDALIAAHPISMGFIDLLSGPIREFHTHPKTSNNCCSRISYALNKIPGHYVNCDGDYGNGGSLVKKVRFFMDLDGYEYIFSTIDLTQYLNNRYGNGEIMPNTSKIGARKGIIVFNPPPGTVGHADIWGDGHIDNPGHFDSTWYEKIQKHSVVFWDLNP